MNAPPSFWTVLTLALGVAAAVGVQFVNGLDANTKQTLSFGIISFVSGLVLPQPSSNSKSSNPVS